MSNIYYDFCGWFVGYFATCIVLIVGSRLSTKYRSLCRDFEVQLLENTNKSKASYLYGRVPTVFKIQHELQYFEAEFQKFKRCFQDFDLVAGNYALAIIIESSIGILYFLFDIYQPDFSTINGKAADVLAILEIFLTVFLFAHIGTFIESEVSRIAL